MASQIPLKLTDIGGGQGRTEEFGATDQVPVANLPATTSPTDTTAGRIWRTEDMVKTLSNNDDTPGSMLRTGDFGWGSVTAVNAVGGGFDCDDLDVTGVYTISASTLHGPLFGISGGVILVLARSIGAYSQVFLGGDAMYFRYFNVAWQPWRRAWADSGANLITDSAGSLGYGAGSGGTVTQATSKSTPVTINKPSGRITTSAAALAAGTAAIFTVNNAAVAANDVVVLTGPTGGNAANYHLTPISMAAGSFGVRIINYTPGSLSEAIQINFVVIKGTIA